MAGDKTDWGGWDTPVALHKVVGLDETEPTRSSWDRLRRYDFSF